MLGSPPAGGLVVGSVGVGLALVSRSERIEFSGLVGLTAGDIGVGSGAAMVGLGGSGVDTGGPTGGGVVGSGAVGWGGVGSVGLAGGVSGCTVAAAVAT